MKTIHAKHFHHGRARAVRVGVVHCTATPDQDGSAVAVANYFKRGSVVASAHVVCDAKTRVRCVKDSDTAFAAPYVNADGVHVEIVGLASQSAAKWWDLWSRRAITNGAKTMAEWCVKYAIPVRKLTREQLRNGERGIIGHVDATAVYGGSHVDPGPHFPWKRFLSLVAKFVRKLRGTPSPAPRPKKAATLPAYKGPYRRGQRSNAYLVAVRDLLGLRVPAKDPYGPRTERVVERFQETAGLDPDGVIGPNTDAALRRRAAGS